MLMKHFEYAADSFAVQAGYGDALSSALTKITAGHTGEFSFTHPTTDKRVDRMAPINPLSAAAKVVKTAYETVVDLAA